MMALNFIIALILTEATEVTMAFIFGYRDKRVYIALLIINIITNPLLNCILMILYYFEIHSFIVVPVLESLVILWEWKLFKYTLENCKKPFLVLSIIINLSSYIAGLIYW
jgi:hypothetical protein